jgi:hypothetical protein
MDDVFIGSEALASGALTRGQLRWNYRLMYPDVYIAKEVTPSLLQRTVGAWLWSRRRGVISGLAAAARHGARDIDNSSDIELIWCGKRPPPGIVARNERIEGDEVADIEGLPVTSAERTALDLARHCARDAAVVRLDALASATGLTLARVTNLLDRYRGGRNITQSVEALVLMDGGSRSPKETMVRLALRDAGFPPPRTDFRLTDGAAGATIALGYEAPKVGVDFGSAGPDFAARMGWKMIPAGDMGGPQLVVYHVRAAVIERGYPLWRLRRVSRG